MSRLYHAVIIGPDEPASWLTAAALAQADLRVALILAEAWDAELVEFPYLPLPVHRLANIMTAAGLRPAAAPLLPYLAEMQTISSESILDLIAQPEHWERNLLREYQGMTSTFLRCCHELEQMAEHVAEAARPAGFPYQTIFSPGSLLSRLRKKKNAGWLPPSSPPFSSWAQGLTVDQTAAFLAAASALLSAPLSSHAPLLLVALLWKTCRTLHPGGGPSAGLREQTMTALSKRGNILVAEAEALIAERGRLRSIRLRGGVVLDAYTLIASAETFCRLLGWKKPEPPSLGPISDNQPITRLTCFYKIERSTIPESLAPRVIVICHPLQPLTGDNFLILSRSPRVPARETLAVTLFNPPPNLDPQDIPLRLAQTLPWLDAGQITPDDTRPPQIKTSSPFPLTLSATVNQELPLENLFLLPSDLLPGWGLAGIPIALAALLPRLFELLKKYKAPQTW